MKSNKFLFTTTLFALLFAVSNIREVLFAQVGEFPLQVPPRFETTNKQEDNIPSQIEVEKISNFPQIIKKTSGQRISATQAAFNLNSRLRISVDSSLYAKTAMIGDYFKAHTIEDFYIPTESPQLLIPKGSWVRGRISSLKKPNILIMSGKIGIHLDQIATPLGDVTPLSAEIDIQQGLLNNEGILDPLINPSNKTQGANQPVYINLPAKTISAKNLGFSLVNKLVSGSLLALFSEGDNISLHKGQELQIVLKNDINLDPN